MKKVPFVLLAFLCACSKQQDLPLKSVSTKTPEKCFFGITNFNLTKRAPLPAMELMPAAGPRNQPTSPSSVILLDFNGHNVSNTFWNVSGDINCAPANLTTAEQATITDMVAEDYRPFNVLVTTDETVYNSTNANKRMRVVVTETWEWYGQTGGTSYIGSFTWGDNTPCFIFSSLLNYNLKQIGEGCSHEVGHTLGLRHQSTFDAACNYLSEYNYGQGEGALSWAPIMGVGYYKNLTTWHNGTSISCTNPQDEISIINSVLTTRADDYSNTASGAASLRDPKEGIITNNTDVDFFYSNANTPKTISVIPFSASNGQGINLDIQIKVYNTNGVLLATVNDETGTGVNTVLPAGKNYIAVSTTPNANATTYGMMGKYTIQAL